MPVSKQSFLEKDLDDRLVGPKAFAAAIHLGRKCPGWKLGFRRPPDLKIEPHRCHLSLAVGTLSLRIGGPPFGLQHFAPFGQCGNGWAFPGIQLRSTAPHMDAR